MKSFHLFFYTFFFFAVMVAPFLFSQDLPGIWEKDDRFLEIADEETRIVLKPYYGFVYESSPWFPSKSDGVSEIHKTLSIRYPSEKTDASIDLAIIKDRLYLNFYQKIPLSTDMNAITAAPTLDGFWISNGTNTGIRLYREPAIDGFYGYYFSNKTYARIYYWKTDARIRDISARFTDLHGVEIKIPKFFSRNGITYTCITGTGSVLKNFETGTFTISEENNPIADHTIAVHFEPSEIVYAGTQAEYRNSLEITLSNDGNYMAIGKADFVRSSVSDLTSAILEHNAKRRPGRKPLLEFMSLDFRWDDIERIRNNGDLP